MSWLREQVTLPDGATGRAVAERLTAAGLQVERVEVYGHDISGVVVARVLSVEELTGYKKPVRWVTLDDGTSERQVICGATNFVAGDIVAYARPPAELPGGFTITARKAYDHRSDGMICSGRELGLSDDHEGILVLSDDLTLGDDVVDALALRDEVLDISINPDRGYALSVRGVAREAATSYIVDFHDPASTALPDTTEQGYPVRIEDTDGCDRYVARTLTDLDPSGIRPAWLQRRIVLAGMRSISLVVDVTNYVMLGLGQPMHAFDRDRLRGPIIVRRAAAGERLTTLDGVDRALDPRDLVIADDSGPVALAGVMGGAATEIGPGTRNVVLESAHFDPVSVALTARRHRLGSEASRRYERGVDHALAPYAAQLAIDLLTTLGGAADSLAVTDVDHRPPPPRIEMPTGMPSRIAGMDYSADTVRSRLVDVGCEVRADADLLTVTPPPWRPDLRRDVDLVEEVVRLEGYDRLPSTVPRASAGPGLTAQQRLRRQVGRALAADGYAEVLSSTFTDEAVSERLRLPADDPRIPSVRLANPVSDEEPYLRSSLLGGLLATLARNLGRGLPDVALYEIGSVFRARPQASAAPTLPAGVRPSDSDLAALDAALPDQPSRLAVVATGNRERPGWWGRGRAASWSDAVESIRSLACELDLTVAVESATHAPFHPGRCAALSIDGQLLGHAGEIDPRVAAAYDLPGRIAAAEIALDVLIDAVPAATTATPLSTYPPATLDIAVAVPSDVAAGDVEAAIRDGAGGLVEQLRLFDVFDGEQVGAGRRSLAFSLRLRAPDRTLTTEEIAAVRDAAVAEAHKRHGAELRAG